MEARVFAALVARDWGALGEAVAACSPSTLAPFAPRLALDALSALARNADHLHAANVPSSLDFVLRQLRMEMMRSTEGKEKTGEVECLVLEQWKHYLLSC